jgi:hypothetical protein
MFSKVRGTCSLKMTGDDASTEKTASVSVESAAAVCSVASGKQCAAVKFSCKEVQDLSSLAGQTAVEDTPGWNNGIGAGKSCAYYASIYCAGGKARSGKEWTLGSGFNYPEDNCVVCGKGSNDGCRGDFLCASSKSAPSKTLSCGFATPCKCDGSGTGPGGEDNIGGGGGSTNGDGNTVAVNNKTPGSGGVDGAGMDLGPIIAGVVAGLLLIVAIVVIAAIIVKRRRGGGAARTQKGDSSANTTGGGIRMNSITGTRNNDTVNPANDPFNKSPTLLPALPHGWSQLQDETGKAYFHNASTGTTSWDRPSIDSIKIHKTTSVTT